MRNNKSDEGAAMAERFIAADIERLDSLIELTQDAQKLVVTPGAKRKALAELAMIEKRLDNMRRRKIEMGLADMIWRYLDYCPDQEAASELKGLLIKIGMMEDL
jgi:hypothetical protein